MSVQEHFVIVAGPDATKYKMVMKTEVAHLAISKIKRYLQKSVSVPPDRQVLRFNGGIISDNAVGSDVGLFDGAILQLDVLQPAASSVRRSSRSGTPKAERPPCSPSTPQQSPSILSLENQQRQIDALREHVFQMSQRSPQPCLGQSFSSSVAVVKVGADEKIPMALRHFCDALSVPTVLQLDSNHTCNVNVPIAGGDPVALLITFDPNTGRLHLYATLLNQLPADPSLRLGLYEALMEGALLGRDMAGGGVGLSSKNNLVLMSVSFDLAHSDERCLAAATRPFLDAVIKWTSIAQSFAA